MLLAAHSPAVNLLGISTVFGNAPLPNTTHNTLAVLTALRRPHIPVHPGSALPLVGTPLFAAHVHGASGLGGTTCLPFPAAKMQATALPETLCTMYNALISTPPETAWLIAIGTMTNIALLFKAYPDLAPHLAGLSLMGGAVGNPFTNADLTGPLWDHDPTAYGNTTRYAEFNIFSDPEAASQLFANIDLQDKITLITLDLSHLVLATRDVKTRLAGGDERSDVRRLYGEMMEYFSRAYPTLPGPPMHDPLAVAVVLAPALFDDRGGERYAVEVILEDTHATPALTERGRTAVRKLEAGQAGIRIPRGVTDLTAIWDMIDACLVRAETTSIV